MKINVNDTLHGFEFLRKEELSDISATAFIGKHKKSGCEILFLDDNYNADKTAASAGMKVCGVYDDSSRDYAEEIKKVSHHYINDFGEILEL